jgi:sulfoxide reductase heme-binding subunit YedZ
MAFSYALLHFLVYAVLELELQLGELGRELARRPYILVGTVALLALIPLAITSTDRMMRRLGRRWQRLHRLIYPITALGIWHYYWQVKADIREPLIYLGLLALLLAWRARSAWLRRRSRQVPAASPR